MNDTDLKYSEAIRYLDDNFAYFLTDILNIGTPKVTGQIPTAAVAILKKDEKKDPTKAFQFLFNPNLLTSNSASDNAFILAHETMHIVLNHLKLFQSDKFSDKRKANIAADCVINDYLVSNMGFSVPELPSLPSPPDGGPKLCFGEAKIGQNAANLTVREVYDKLPDDEGECDGDHGDGDGNGQPCDGSCQKSKAGDGQFDDHGWMHDATQEEQDAAEKASEGANVPDALKRTKQDDDYQSQLPPGSGVGNKETFTEDNNVSLKWADLLEEVDPFVFKKGPRPRPDWTRQSRKLTALRSASRLPVDKPGNDREFGRNKPAIVMALDTSGSIGQEQANQFVNMARSVPAHKIKLFVCTFTTQYQELDLENPEWSSGGTHFDCISQYVEDVVRPQNKKKYPSAVIVVTDGDANFSDKKPQGAEAKSWWWLMTRDDQKELYSGEEAPGKCLNLSDFAVGVK